jgi:hypothetical protein
MCVSGSAAHKGDDGECRNGPKASSTHQDNLRRRWREGRAAGSQCNVGLQLWDTRLVQGTHALSSCVLDGHATFDEELTPTAFAQLGDAPVSNQRAVGVSRSVCGASLRPGAPAVSLCNISTTLLLGRVLAHAPKGGNLVDVPCDYCGYPVVEFIGTWSAQRDVHRAMVPILGGASTGSAVDIGSAGVEARRQPAACHDSGMTSAILLRRGVILERVTLAWNAVGIVVLGVAAVMARSVALAGFGLDSLVEIGASAVVLWELSGTGASRRRRALRLIAAAFIVLATYIAVQSTIVLVTGYHAKPSALGIGWTAVTAVAMFGLAGGKARTGKALGNPVLMSEGRVTFIDGLLATAVLIGLALNALLGAWWADPLAGFVIVFYGFKEAHSILGGKSASGKQ